MRPYQTIPILGLLGPAIACAAVCSVESLGALKVANLNVESAVVAPLARGYAVAINDAGHQAGGTDARWALTPEGAADEAKIADYFYRATHSVTVAAKQMVVQYYGGKVIQQAYFAGCSNGGRMALMEA